MGLFGKSTTKTRTFEFSERVERIELDVAAVAMTIRPSTGDTRVETTVSGKPADLPEVDVELVGSTLRISNTIAARSLHKDARVRMEIKAPADVVLAGTTRASSVDSEDCGSDVDIEADASKLTLRGAPGSVQLRVNASAVRLESPRGDLEIDAKAGKVDVRDAQSERVRISAQAGAVAVQLATRPTDVAISVQAGSVDVELPEGGYALHMQANLGTIDTSGVENDTTSDSRVSVEANVGKVRLRGVAAGVGADAQTGRAPVSV